MLIATLAIYVLSLLTALFYDRYRTVLSIIQTVTILGVVAYFSTLLFPVIQGSTFSTTMSWVDSLGIHLQFYVDGLSLFFVFLITLIGLLVLLYSFSYMKHYQQQGRFFAYLLFFMGSMLGLVLSVNLISLFVFWELTSLSSFLLIGFENQKEESRRAARQALLITAGGGLALMSGFILLELMIQSDFDLLQMINSPDEVAKHPLQKAAIVLIAIGAFTKSAQFPFHFWLPNAMAAPTPVSAYLHSATMVKAGVYLIFRLNPVLEGIELWGHLLGLTGAVTMVWGAFKSLQEDDLKKILAYTTISALGIFFMMTGVGGEEAINAAIVYVLAHALYKGGLFLTAGSIDHQTGTRSISALSDLWRVMPYTSLALILCFASMAGVIPFIGFVGKESLYDALYHTEETMPIIYLGLLFLASVFFTAVAIDVSYQAIFKKGLLEKQKVKEPGLKMLVAPLVLAVIGLFAGIFPEKSIEPLLQWSAAITYNGEVSMKLKLWHGFNSVLILSVVTWLAGVILYLFRNTIRKFSKPIWLESDYLYDKVMSGLEGSSKAVTRVIQNGYIRNYIAVVVLTFVLLIVMVLFDGNLLKWPGASILFRDIQIYEVVIFLLVIIATVFLFRTTSRLIVTATFGIVGYSIALSYTLFSAPDVAITQFLAETLSLILLILILHRLPSYTLQQRIPHQWYLPIAVIFGLVMTFISFTILNSPKESGLKEAVLANSISKGKGENAVNVILVDFRALDTFGEITVLAVTMLGIIALLRLKSKKI